MIPQTMLLLAPLVFGEEISSNLNQQSLSSGQIPNAELEPALTAEQVAELIRTRDNLTAETKQWPRARKLGLMVSISVKRQELAELELELEKCEKAIKSETKISIQWQGSTFEVIQPHIEQSNPMNDILSQIATKAGPTGTSFYESSQRIAKFLTECGILRYNLNPDKPQPFDFTAPVTTETNRRSKIQYIQNILNDNWLLHKNSENIKGMLNGKAADGFYINDKTLESLLWPAFEKYKGPPMHKRAIQDALQNGAFLRERIAQRHADLPKILAAYTQCIIQ